MEIVKNEEAIRHQKNVLLLTGLWPKRSPSVTYRIWGNLNLFFAFTAPMFLFHGIIITKDFSMLVENWQWLLHFVNYAGKLFLITIHKQKMLLLLDFIEEPVFYDYGIELNKYIRNSVKVTNLLGNAFNYFSVAGAFFICLVAIIRSTAEKKLLLDFGIDFCGKSTILFNIVCFYQVHVFLVATFNVTSMDTMLFSLLRLIKAHFEILRCMIIDTTNDLCDTYDGRTRLDDEEINKVISRRLNKCIMYHTAILRFAAEVEEIFRYICLFQFLNSAATLCMISFIFTNASPGSMESIKSVVIICILLFQISLLCVFGNEMMDESLKVGDACYETNWVEYSPKVRKMLFIIMERSKRPTVVTAGKFVILSLPALISILRAAYSYGAVLQQLYKQ